MVATPDDILNWAFPALFLTYLLRNQTEIETENSLTRLNFKITNSMDLLLQFQHILESDPLM